MIVKVSVLIMNNQFSTEEKMISSKFQQSIRSTFMTLVSFHEVEYSYDRKFLIDSFEQHRKILKQMIEKHLSDKSNERIDNFMDVFTCPTFFDFFFGTIKSKDNSKANQDILLLRNDIANGLKCLLENFHM